MSKLKVIRITPPEDRKFKGTKKFQQSLNALLPSPNPERKNVSMFLNVIRVNNKDVAYLVFAETDSEGNLNLDNTVSLELPCPPYCEKPEGINIELAGPSGGSQ